MEGKTALGKYRLLRRLGAGSNAEVFLAQPPEGARQVVVKRVFPHVAQHPKFRQLFEAEIASMSNFHHPYAVQFLEASYADPLGPCLVMEYVPGLTLEAVQKRHRVLELDRIGRLLGYFCHALDAAHEAGIIHRDLKPANLMVANVGTVKESLKVMDFGFAGFSTRPHLQLSSLTGKGGIHAMGTPEYISPEMIRGDRVDGRSDIYSVGVILYEMLTGRLPFECQDLDSLLGAHAHREPPRFANMGAKNIPPEVEAVVRLALSKFPIERQQRAQDVAQMYGAAVGEDFWTATAPEGWEPPLPMADLYTPPARPAPDLPADPYRISHEFHSFIPERLVAAKIRGFVDDLKGEVLESEPGLIRLRLGVPSTHQDAPATGSTILSWFRTARKPVVVSGHEPIEMEMTLAKPDPTQVRMQVVVAFRPMKEYPPTCPRTWRSRCDTINTMLRQYMGA
jgi:eukaryotic-like serine/threonine-protein kinase